MDSQVKERIVGAVVLVAIGVWFFPWILDGTDDADPTPVTTPVLAPAEDQLPVRTETVNLDPLAPDAQPESEESAPALPPRTEVLADTAPAEQPPVEEPEVQQPAAEQPVAEQQADAEPVVAPPEPVASPPVAAVESGWIVQLGSFGEEANARQLAGRVADYGFDARVTEFETRGRLLHRVRVSGYATRAQAEAAVSSLSAHGFVAQVVSPEE